MEGLSYPGYRADRTSWYRRFRTGIRPILSLIRCIVGLPDLH